MISTANNVPRNRGRKLEERTAVCSLISCEWDAPAEMLRSVEKFLAASKTLRRPARHLHCHPPTGLSCAKGDDVVDLESLSPSK